MLVFVTTYDEICENFDFCLVVGHMNVFFAQNRPFSLNKIDFGLQMAPKCWQHSHKTCQTVSESVHPLFDRHNFKISIFQSKISAKYAIQARKLDLRNAILKHGRHFQQKCCNATQYHLLPSYASQRTQHRYPVWRVMMTF